jgi:hypothetical protein
VGTGPGRDPTDADPERAARPDRGAGRRPAEDGTRRDDRRPARCRRVRVRHGAARRVRLHHDAGLPSRHLPGRDRHPESRPAQEVHRQGRVRRQLHGVRGGGGPGTPRRVGFRTLEEAIGHAEMLDVSDALRSLEGEPGSGPQRDPARPRHGVDTPRSAKSTGQEHGLDEALDQTIIQLAGASIETGDRISLDLPIRNVNRTVGTLLGHYVTEASTGAKDWPTTRSPSTSRARRA